MSEVPTNNQQIFKNHDGACYPPPLIHLFPNLLRTQIRHRNCTKFQIIKEIEWKRMMEKKRKKCKDDRYISVSGCNDDFVSSDNLIYLSPGYYDVVEDPGALLMSDVVQRHQKLNQQHHHHQKGNGEYNSHTHLSTDSSHFISLSGKTTQNNPCSIVVPSQTAHNSNLSPEGKACICISGSVTGNITAELTLTDITTRSTVNNNYTNSSNCTCDTKGHCSSVSSDHDGSALPTSMVKFGHSKVLCRSTEDMDDTRDITSNCKNNTSLNLSSGAYQQFCSDNGSSIPPFTKYSPIVVTSPVPSPHPVDTGESVSIVSNTNNIWQPTINIPSITHLQNNRIAYTHTHHINGTLRTAVPAKCYSAGVGGRHMMLHSIDGSVIWKMADSVIEEHFYRLINYYRSYYDECTGMIKGQEGSTRQEPNTGHHSGNNGNTVKSTKHPLLNYIPTFYGVYQVVKVGKVKRNKMDLHGLMLLKKRQRQQMDLRRRSKRCNYKCDYINNENLSNYCSTWSDGCINKDQGSDVTTRCSNNSANTIYNNDDIFIQCESCESCASSCPTWAAPSEQQDIIIRKERAFMKREEWRRTEVQNERYKPQECELNINSNTENNNCSINGNESSGEGSHSHNDDGYEESCTSCVERMATEILMNNNNINNIIINNTQGETSISCSESLSWPVHVAGVHSNSLLSTPKVPSLQRDIISPVRIPVERHECDMARITDTSETHRQPLNSSVYWLSDIENTDSIANNKNTENNKSKNEERWKDGYSRAHTYNNNNNNRYDTSKEHDTTAIVHLFEDLRIKRVEKQIEELVSKGFVSSKTPLSGLCYGDDKANTTENKNLNNSYPSNYWIGLGGSSNYINNNKNTINPTVAPKLLLRPSSCGEFTTVKCQTHDENNNNCQSSDMSNDVLSSNNINNNNIGSDLLIANNRKQRNHTDVRDDVTAADPADALKMAKQKQKITSPISSCEYPSNSVSSVRSTPLSHNNNIISLLRCRKEMCYNSLKKHSEYVKKVNNKRGDRYDNMMPYCVVGDGSCVGITSPEDNALNSENNNNNNNNSPDINDKCSVAARRLAMFNQFYSHCLYNQELRSNNNNNKSTAQSLPINYTHPTHYLSKGVDLYNSRSLPSYYPETHGPELSIKKVHSKNEFDDYNSDEMSYTFLMDSPLKSAEGNMNIGLEGTLKPSISFPALPNDTDEEERSAASRQNNQTKDNTNTNIITSQSETYMVEPTLSPHSCVGPAVWSSYMNYVPRIVPLLCTTDESIFRHQLRLRHYYHYMRQALAYLLQNSNSVMKGAEECQDPAVVSDEVAEQLTSMVLNHGKWRVDVVGEDSNGNIKQGNEGPVMCSTKKRKKKKIKNLKNKQGEIENSLDRSNGVPLCTVVRQHTSDSSGDSQYNETNIPDEIKDEKDITTKNIKDNTTVQYNNNNNTYNSVSSLHRSTLREYLHEQAELYNIRKTQHHKTATIVQHHKNNNNNNKRSVNPPKISLSFDVNCRSDITDPCLGAFGRKHDGKGSFVGHTAQDQIYTTNAETNTTTTPVTPNTSGVVNPVYGRHWDPCMYSCMNNNNGMPLCAKPRPTEEGEKDDTNLVTPMIALSDQCTGMRIPCVLDLKMGTRQYGIWPSPAKLASKIRKANATSTGQYGVRIAGMRHCDIWAGIGKVGTCRNKEEAAGVGDGAGYILTDDGLSEEEQQKYKMRQLTKADGMKIDINGLGQSMLEFLLVRAVGLPSNPYCCTNNPELTTTDNNNIGTEAGQLHSHYQTDSVNNNNNNNNIELSKAALLAKAASLLQQTFLTKVIEFKRVFESQNDFRFFTSSLLLLYDAGPLAELLETCEQSLSRIDSDKDINNNNSLNTNNNEKDITIDSKKKTNGEEVTMDDVEDAVKRSKANLCMIDFAFTYPTAVLAAYNDADGNTDCDEGYIRGLRTIESLLMGVAID